MTSTDAQKRERVALEVLAEVTGCAVDGLARDQDLVADLGVDSPRALRLLVELEDRLDVEIDDDAAGRIRTVGDLLAAVEALESGG